MPVKWEKVYVFISSTFNDMHAERDYLVKRVFPKLRDWCERRKLRLVDIDLRWGVTEADSSSKRAVKVCLERINDCRPFFLCFLGQRHGWTPGVEGISDDTYEDFPELRKALEAHPDASVTELEILHAIISPFASRDSKDRSKLIRFDPAEQAFFYLRDPRYVKDFRDAPRQLQCIYTDDVGPEDETEEERRYRGRSREALRNLREGLIPKNARHKPVVYGAIWRPELRTPEIALPLACPSLDENNRRRWRSMWNRFGHLGLEDTDLEVPGKKRTKAEEYNKSLTKGRLTNFHASEAVDDIPSNTELALVIERQLQQAISARFPDHLEVVGETDLQRELDQQEQFLFVSSEGFIERKGDFKELDGYVESESDKLFVLTAPGGMGKSTLLANWIDRYRTYIEGRPSCSVHFRFVGASDRSTTVYSLLRLLLQEMKEIGQKLDEEIPEDPTKLREAWPKLLEAIGEGGKTVFVIDGLNQLESGLSDFDWLPWELPSNIKMIVSFKRGEPAAEEFYKRLKESGQVVLSEVKPFEDEEDRRKLVRAYLDQYLKELDKPLLEAIIQSPGAKNPLYLKIVLSELRVFGAFVSLEDKIRSDFGDSPVSAFQSILARLEIDPAYSAIEPKQAVPLLFGLLAHARHGLSPDELSGMFTQALRKKDVLQANAAADAVHLFLRQVRPFLARREGRYDFFFESFRNAAQERYVAKSLSDPSPRRLAKLWHGLLAVYFKGLPNWDAEGLGIVQYGARRPVRRKVAELPYHLTCGESWKDLAVALCDLDFIEAKCTARMTYDLVADYHAGLAAIGADEDTAEFRAIAEFGGFVKGEAHALSTYPWLTFQQAANQPDRSGVAIAARRRWETKAERRPWIQWVNKLQEAGPCIMTLKGHSAFVSACVYSPDGRRILSASCDGTLKVWDAETGAEIATLGESGVSADACAYSADGKRILSASYGTLMLWDAETGARIAILGHGNSPEVRACVYSPDGRRILCASSGTLMLWDAETGAEIATLKGHLDAVGACVYSPDGRRILSASYDGTLRVWDAETGAEIAVLEGHSGSVLACAYSPDGRRILSASADRTLRVWDAETGAEIAVLEGHSGRVEACVYSPDGRRILSGSEDNTLRIWDAETGVLITNLLGHSGSVLACAYSPDGRRIISGSLDNTLKVWDAETGTQIAARGHSRWVEACVYSPDGRRILSASYDGTLRVWDAETGAEIAVLEGHSECVEACAYSPDGRRILSGSKMARTLKLWDAETGAEIATLLSHSEVLEYLSFNCAYSPDGRRILSATYDGTLKVWDAETGVLITNLKGHSDTVLACAYSPDGRRILSASYDGTLRVWDAETGAEIAVLEGHSGSVLACAYSPDGRRILSATYDGTLKVWDAETGAEIAVLEGHSGSVLACAYSPDGRRIISASLDNTLRVWDTETGSEIGCFVARGSIHTFAIKGSFQLITAGDDGGFVYLLRRAPSETTLPISSIMYSYCFDSRSWSPQPTAMCEWCGQRFTPSRAVLEAIRDFTARAGLAEDESPLRGLPSDPRDDARLTSECACCRKPLRFNPFIVDNRDRY